jgi:hypothetical protein
MSSHKVTVTYAHPGAQPPIYLAGSFSDWQPEELEYTKEGDEYIFKKDVVVKGGEYQYKFRIGPGDWWVLNEDAPTGDFTIRSHTTKANRSHLIVTDELGNRNNLLSVPVSKSEIQEQPQSENNKAISTEPTKVEPSEELSETEKADVQTLPITEPTSSQLPDPVSTYSTSVMEEKSGESSGSEPILTPPTPSPNNPESDLSDPILLHENTITDPPSSIPQRVPTPIPDIVIEKVDDKPSHGDEFGDSATEGQKIAHEMRAQDAEPDLVIIKPEISPEAETAAEVADTAAALDKAKPESFNTIEKVNDNSAEIVIAPVNPVQEEKENHRQLSDVDIASPAAHVETPKLQLHTPAQDDSTAVETSEPHYLIENQDPEPQTPDEIAAEVADAAVFLDREEPQPTTTDEEAGRTGERRMSHTPIPEVARTAAEVADSAAIIDRDDVWNHSLLFNDHANSYQLRAELPRFKFLESDSGGASGTVTPANERAPLFAHECPVPHGQEEDFSHPRVEERLSSHEEAQSFNFEDDLEEENMVDTNDPTLEAFPSDRPTILRTVKSCESRLNADETNFEGSPSSPVVNGSAIIDDVEEPSSARLDAQTSISPVPSPILDIISEEHQHEEDLSPLPSPSKPSDDGNSDSTKLESPGDVLLVKELPPGTTVVVEQVEGQEDSAIPLEEEEPRKDHSIQESPLGTRHEPIAATEFVTAVPSLSKVVDPESAPLGYSLPKDDKPDDTEPVSTHDFAPSAPITADSSITKTPDEEVISDGETLVDNKEEAGNEGPQIVIQPATPQAFTSEIFPKVTDAAKSTSFENEPSGGSNIKIRNAPAIDRSGTPTSLNSPKKDTESTQSIFEALWNLSFVQWIGGLITRLCGGRRRP